MRTEERKNVATMTRRNERIIYTREKEKEEWLNKLRNDRDKKNLSNVERTTKIRKEKEKKKDQIERVFCFQLISFPHHLQLSWPKTPWLPTSFGFAGIEAKTKNMAATSKNVNETLNKKNKCK